MKALRHRARRKGELLKLGHRISPDDDRKELAWAGVATEQQRADSLAGIGGLHSSRPTRLPGSRPEVDGDAALRKALTSASTRLSLILARTRRHLVKAPAGQPSP
jgi:hypothetical protein